MSFEPGDVIRLKKRSPVPEECQGRLGKIICPVDGLDTLLKEILMGIKLMEKVEFEFTSETPPSWSSDPLLAQIRHARKASGGGAND